MNKRIDLQVLKSNFDFWKFQTNTRIPIKKKETHNQSSHSRTSTQKIMRKKTRSQTVQSKPFKVFYSTFLFISPTFSQQPSKTLFRKCNKQLIEKTYSLNLLLILSKNSSGSSVTALTNRSTTSLRS